MIVARPQLRRIDDRFTEGRWDRMNYDIEPRDKSLEHLLHRFAADQSCVGQSRDVPGDFFLQRLKPKLALPRRARCKEFVKNYDQTALKSFANATQNRY